MNITIKRYSPQKEPNSISIDYELPFENITLLEALTYIKTKVDPSLTFSSGCRSEVCGSCAVRVNDREVLSCAYKVQDGDRIEPLRRVEVLKDLVVDHQKAQDTLKRVKSWISNESNKTDMSIQEEKRIEIQSDCILCSSCFSSCPVLEIDKEFLGPFALTRAFRYVNDVRCEDEKEKIDAVQAKGIWDCTLCGECTLVCPQKIDPKNDIMMLQSKSAQYGYNNPAFTAGSFDDFGFNPGF